MRQCAVVADSVSLHCQRLKAVPCETIPMLPPNTLITPARQESDGPNTGGPPTNGRGHWDGCPWGFWTLSALSALLAVLDLFYPHQVRHGLRGG